MTLDEPRINDLSPLPALPNLREVKISNRMRAAQNSLGGNYGFELIVE